MSNGRRVTRCAFGEGDPVAYLNGLGAIDLVVSSAPTSPKQIKQAVAADAGEYRVMRVRGKLGRKPDEISSASSSPRATAAIKHAARNPSAVLTGAGYIQAGAYAEPENTDRAIAHLKSLGLKVSTSQSRKDQQILRIVLAGPFDTSDEIALALQLVRQAGYLDAFIRR